MEKAKPDLSRDPVCGMMVDPRRCAGREEHGGKTFHFCSKGCYQAFRADPHRYGHVNG